MLVKRSNTHTTHLFPLSNFQDIDSHDMAVLKSLEVFIEVERKPLQEYADDTITLVDPNTITRYVEATTDKEFKIVMVIRRDFDWKGCNAICFKQFLDGGKCVSDFFHLKKDVKEHEKDHVLDYSTECGGVSKKTREGELFRPFVFSELKPGM